MDDDAARTEAGRLVLVLTTEGDTERASQLAETLIDRRIAACVTMQEIRSLYRWEGEVVEDAEVQLVIKTDVATVPSVRATIDELHSYDLPEIVVLDASASAEYARWVAGEVV